MEVTIYMNDFGEKINALRNTARLSQEEFAKKIGVSRQTVSKWEAGMVKPEIDKIILMCRCFNVDAGYFIDIDDEITSFAKERQTLLKYTKAEKTRDGFVLFELNHVSKKYGNGKIALDNINLKFADTGLIAIVGSSGSGKSNYSMYCREWTLTRVAK